MITSNERCKDCNRLRLEEGGSARTQPPPTERVAEKEESGLSLKSVTDNGGAADVPSCNVPRWLQEVMSRDEITVLSKAMHKDQVHEADLEFIDNHTLIQAGIVNGFSRAKILSRIQIMFKQEKGGATDDPSSNVPRWLQEAMNSMLEDEIGRAHV